MNELNTIVSEVLASRLLDRRTCFTSIYAEAPAGDRLVFECSDAAVSNDVKERLAGGDDARVRFVVLPNGRMKLPTCVITVSSVADVRKEPSHTSELVSQTVFGDEVAPLKVDGEWYLVRLGDGYVGWIRSWHLKTIDPVELERFQQEARHRVRDNIIQVFTEPSERSLPVTDAVVGTHLIATSCGTRGWRNVVFPGELRGFAEARSIEPVPAGRRVSRERIAATGTRFLGIPYLWGGTTPKGFDCSGLIQRTFHLHGVSVPRDSDQQSLFGKLKKTGRPGDLNTGDLIFFGKSEIHITHVAMMLSNGLFLHAHGQVKVGSLDPAHPLFEAKLARNWRISRDPISS